MFDHGNFKRKVVRRYTPNLVRWNALGYLRAGGRALTLNCGDGQGFSVLEVLSVVKETSGVDFQFKNAPRRPGDAVRIVAESELIRETARLASSL